jgi:hypothetical protein
MRTQTFPVMLGINGPAHSGKTWLIKYLEKAIPDAIVLRPSDELYRIMQEEGSAPNGMAYQDFKKLPDARGRLIRRATELRAVDPHVFSRRITASQEWQNARVVILDNIGFPDEIGWFDAHAVACILLRLDTPFNEIEPLKSRSRQLRDHWNGDSRFPVEHHTMLTAYDSHQMTLLLDWLRRPLTREEAGPYYGIKSLWTRYFAASESFRGVHSDGGTAGELGGLGQAIG